MAKVKENERPEDLVEVKTYNRDSRFGEFLGLMQPDRIFSFDATLNPVARKLVWLDQIRNGTTSLPQQVLPFKTPEGDGLVLPYGLTVVSGRTGVGKTTLLKAIEYHRPNYVFAKTGEPFDTDEDVIAGDYHDFDTALVASIREVYSSDEDVMAESAIMIDSLRAALFESTGAAGSKGMTMPFFSRLTRVSNRLASNGLTVVATVNPMNEDSEFVTEFLSKLSASTAGFIQVDDVKRGNGITISGQYSVRPDRARKPFSITAEVEVPAVGVDEPITFSFDDTNHRVDERTSVLAHSFKSIGA